MRMLAALLFCTASLAASSDVTQVEWSRTPEVFAGKRVVVELMEHAKIEGNWVSVTPGTFTIKVAKTSNRKAVPKGIQTLPRPSIVSIEMGERRVRGRVIGTLAGYLAGGALVLQGVNMNRGVGTAVIFGLAGAGYVLGQAYDHSTQKVVIIPESGNHADANGTHSSGGKTESAPEIYSHAE